MRLYFANRCSCTSAVGQRQFNVDIDGARKLTNFDVTQAAGDNTGTMRHFAVTSDGNVDIDLSHVLENPLINGIEIVRTDLRWAPDSSIVRRSYSAAGTGPSMVVPTGSIDWNKVRGALTKRSALRRFLRRLVRPALVRRETNYGSAVQVAGQDALVVLADWKNDIAAATGMFYDSQRIYFTVAGSSNLYYRYFNPEDDVVGAKRLVASGNVSGIDFSSVRGMFTDGEKLYWAKPDGSLNAITWQEGALSDSPVGGTAKVVSGPGVDGADWTARTRSLYQDAKGGDATQAPNADFVANCSGLACDFDGSASTAPGTSISSYRWQYGDGTSGQGVRPSHTYATGGTRTVTLTVSTSDGRTASTSQQVTVVKGNGAPTASFTSSCDQLTCAFDAGGSSESCQMHALTYAWDFGDGRTGTGRTVSHPTHRPGGSWCL